MNRKITLMDGAVGTSLWEKAANKVPVWRYNIENPAIVTELHKEMLDAGAEIILANTFGANGGMMKKSPYTVEQVVREGVRLCKETVGAQAKVAFSCGPLTGLMDPYGDITEEEAKAFYDEMISAGMQEKPDILYLQTFIDLSMLKIAAQCARKWDIPLFCSMSFEKVGKTIMGDSVSDMVKELKEFHPEAIGLNCSLGPDLAIPVLKMFREVTDLPIIFKPNAGKVNIAVGMSASEYSAEQFVEDIMPAAEEGASLIGGCCGTNSGHIKTLHVALKQNGWL